MIKLMAQVRKTYHFISYLGDTGQESDFNNTCPKNSNKNFIGCRWPLKIRVGRDSRNKQCRHFSFVLVIINPINMNNWLFLNKIIAPL
jgi:hypothetical protein